ncbi:MAG: PGPGW domain-containing protein [Pseudomonadota bacterium]
MENLNVIYKSVRRYVIFIIGATIILLGVVMIATPGPAIIVIPFGLAILATEFIWARKLLKKFKSKVSGLTPDKNNTKKN